jgi:hypothetical protein
MNKNRLWVTAAYYPIPTASPDCNTENVQKIRGNRILCLQRLSAYITQIKIKCQGEFQKPLYPQSTTYSQQTATKLALNQTKKFPRPFP